MYSYAVYIYQPYKESGYIIECGIWHFVKEAQQSKPTSKF